MKIKVVANTEDYEDFLDLPEIEQALKLLGFTYLEMNFFRKNCGDIVIYVELFDDAIIVDVYKDNQKIDSKTISEPSELISYVEKVCEDNNIELFKVVTSDEIEMSDDGIYPSSSLFASKYTIKAKSASRSRQKTTTRDFVDKLSRVKSSNVWAYAFNPKDEYIGDMLMQFKDKNGGPADIYIYYDVPSKIWRRLVAAPSKGHAFWELIRNRYKYAKLTGDKRTKLPNGI